MTNVEIAECSMNILYETNLSETVKEFSRDVDNETGDKSNNSGGSAIQETDGIYPIAAENVSDNDVDSPVKKSGVGRQRFCDSGTSEDELEDVREMSELNREFEVGNRKIEENVKSDYDIMKSRLKALCDSESSEDEREPLIQSDDVCTEKKIISKSKSSVKKSINPKEKKMSAKVYEEQKLEIKSESQRLQRERNVSLPYHRPKPRSLKEFLEQRPRFTAALSDKAQNASTILAIKMTNQNLEKISMKLEEREKMLEVFYKSESDSENENNPEKSMIDKDDLINVPNICDNTQINENKAITPDENITTHPSEEITSTQLFEKTTGVVEILSEVIIAKNSTINNNTTENEFYVNNSDVNTEKNTFNEPKTVLNQLQFLRESLGNSAPKLTGDPNEIINLHDIQTPNKNSTAINSLIERFIKHSTRKNLPKEESVQIDILTISNGELRNELATMHVYNDPVDEVVAVLETPGAKLKKLRTNLKSQMALRRAEMWKQKSVLNSSAGSGGKDDYEEEEEEEFDVEEEEEDAEELEEDDVDMTEKRRYAKSAFVDEEAEVSDVEDVDEEDDGDEDEEEDVEISNFDTTKKKLKRIIAMDDSDDEDNVLSLNSGPLKDTPICKGPLDSTDPWEDEDDSESQLPPNAQRPPSRQRTPQPTQSKSSTIFGLITPVRQLTALQSFESPLQQSHGLTHPSPVLPLPPDPSPLKGNMWQRHLLFPECDAATNGETTVNMEDLANEICSGIFPSSLSHELIPNDSEEIFIKPLCDVEISSHPSTQDILDICSGDFNYTTENINSNPEKVIQNNFLNDQNRSGVELAQEIKSNVNKTDFVPFVTLESLNDDDDKVISQLLDEEEMEKFKKKFESPLNIDDKAEIQPKSPLRCRIMFDTSDEDGCVNDAQVKMKKLRKKRQKKCLVDDSDEDEVDYAQNENDDFKSVGNRENVDYDSEENEIDKTESESILRAEEFFENEAELSESDWDSADEDEKGLDELDIEVGDEEIFDEDKLRSGIERVQLRQMLDEDNKDLKILQEMLLEDGELHGAGRQRQFRWRNVDSTFDLESNEHDDDQLADCPESEEVWRKRRHERVQFLQSKKDFEEEGILAGNSILKLGQKAIVRNAGALQNTEANAEEVKVKQQQISATIKQPFDLIYLCTHFASHLALEQSWVPKDKILNKEQLDIWLKEYKPSVGPWPQRTNAQLAAQRLPQNKRGSFLSRGEKVLAKVAEFTKLQKGITTGPKKFSRNFLFSTVLNESESDHAKKRKADNSTAIAIKKLRLDVLSPRFSHVSAKTSSKNLFKTT